MWFTSFERGNMNIMVLTLIVIVVSAITAYLITELRVEDFRKAIDDVIESLARAQKKVETETQKVETETQKVDAILVKLQQLEYQRKRDRGALWESVNGLWNIVDKKGKESDSDNTDGSGNVRTENEQ